MPPFEKPALTVPQLLDLCEARKLTINNRESAAEFIRNIGYFRLTGYMRPFLERNQQNGEGDKVGSENFIAETTFENVLDLYFFDRKLRLLTFDAIERIEIAVRATISDTMSLASKNPHWFMKPDNFQTPEDQQNFIESAGGSVGKFGGNVPFIVHYRKEHGEPPLPPSWMIFEILSFTQTSLLYKNLREDRKIEIAGLFNLRWRNFESWIHAIGSVRNMCAHHARLWNTEFGIKPRKLNVLKHHFIVGGTKDGTSKEGKDRASNKKFYPQAVIIKFFLDRIVGEFDWTGKLKSLFDEYPAISTQDMGFPHSWDQDDFWQGNYKIRTGTNRRRKA